MDQVEIVLTPLGAPIGMIEGGALDFRVIVGEVNDQLIGAGRERLEHFLVSFEPLRLGNAGPDLQDLIHDDGIGSEMKVGEIEFAAVFITGEKHGEFIDLAGGEINLEEIISAENGAHVRVEMREVDAGGFGFIHLGVGFRGDIRHFGVGGDVGGEQRKIAIGVEEAGAWGLRRNGRPTVTGPIGIEGKMDAEVGVGMSLGPLRDFGEPRARNEDAGGSDPASIEGLEDGGVYGVHHAEVVGVDDEEARIGGVAEAFGEGFGGGRNRLLGERRREEDG